MTRKQKDVPNEDHFVRYAGPGKLVPRDDGELELTPDAFRLRKGVDEGLSGSWFEFCDCPEAARLGAIIMEWRGQQMTIKRSGRVAVAPVQKIKAVGSKHNRNVRVRHEPFAGSSAYTQVRGVDETDLNLLEELATSAVTRLLPCG